MNETLKKTIRIKSWWMAGGHVYGQDIDNNNKYVRSARAKEIEKADVLDYRHGDTVETFAVTYVLIGARRRKFSDD